MIRNAAWFVWANASWAFHRVGYWIRPFDMLADSRRWCWQPRQRCGFPTGTPQWAVDDVIAAVRQVEASRGEGSADGSGR